MSGNTAIDDQTTSGVSLWDKAEAGILSAGSSVLTWAGDTLVSLGDASETARDSITSGAETIIAAPGKAISAATSWLSGKLIWILVVVAIVAGLIWFGKTKIEKLAGA